MPGTPIYRLATIASVLLLSISSALGAEIVPTPDARAQLYPAIASDGADQFLLVWQQGRLLYEQDEGDIYAIRVSRAGAFLDASPIRVSVATGTQERPRVAYGDGVFLVVWEDNRHGHVDVYGARVSSSGTVMDPDGIRITDRLSTQSRPVAADTPYGFVVAWQDADSGYSRIRATTVDPSGSVATTNGDLLTFGGDPIVGGQVDIARSGSRYVFQVRTDASWRRSSQRGTRKIGEITVSEAGSLRVESLAPLPNGMYGEFPGRVAAIGTRRVLTTGGVSRSISTARIVVLDGSVPLPNPNMERRPASYYDQSLVTELAQSAIGPHSVAAGDDEFAIVVRRREEPGRHGPGVDMYRVDLDGRLLQPLDSPYLVEEVDAYRPAIGHLATAYLIAYEVPDPRGTATRLHVQLVPVFAGYRGALPSPPLPARPAPPVDPQDSPSAPLGSIERLVPILGIMAALGVLMALMRRLRRRCERSEPEPRWSRTHRYLVLVPWIGLLSCAQPLQTPDAADGEARDAGSTPPARDASSPFPDAGVRRRDAGELLEDAGLPPDRYTPPTGPWADEHWGVEPYTEALGGGPDFGPVIDVGAPAAALTSNASGEVFILVGTQASEEHRVDIVTSGGERMPLAGAGYRGYADGPAATALFDFSGLAYQPPSIAADDRGNVYVADTGNRRVRRIYRDAAGAWTVETWAGGGARVLEEGESAPSRDVQLPRVIVAATRAGRVVACSGTGQQCFSVSIDGEIVTRLYVSILDSAAEPVRMSVFQGDCAPSDDCYFITRSPSYVVRVAPDDVVSRIAGIVEWPGPRSRKPLYLGDGPPLDVFLDTTPSLVADALGDAVYVAGGDEYNIRRIPTIPDTSTATLVRNGRWYLMEQHPNGNRGPTEYDPDLTGVSRYLDGELTNLPVSPLIGGDRRGRLYATVNAWSGVGMRVDGAWLSTKVFRLYRRP